MEAKAQRRRTAHWHVACSRWLSRSSFALVGALALPSCAKRSPPDPSRNVTSASPPSSSVHAPSVSGGSRLASPTAFELVAAPDGATLAFAPAGTERPALVRIELDAAGSRRGSASVVLDAKARSGVISDVSGAFVSKRLALAWAERTNETSRVRAAWGEPKARVFELGAAWRAPPTARGNVVVVARKDAALVFARGGEVPCVEPGKHACYAFDFHELGAGGAKKTGLPLSVPVPCTDNATSLAVLPERYHYGVCTDTGGGPVTTMFTITPEPAYARADPVLAGCEPAGTFVWRSSAWLVGECQGQKRAARIGAGDEEVEYLDLRSPRLDCRGGVAAIRASGFELPLDAPRSRLEALLPSAVAPRGARAVFTGRALLVASSVGTSLRVARYTCNGERWDESSVDLE